MMKDPANIDWFHSLETLSDLIGYLPKDVQQAIGGIPSYFVNQRRGRAYRNRKTGKPICWTIPIWVLQRPKDYQIWYVAHEVSHIMVFLAGGPADHGVMFHEMLKQVCPKASQHYEWEYMKRSIYRGVGTDNLEDMI